MTRRSAVESRPGRLLERGDVEEPGLGQEASLCGKLAMGVISFPIADRGVPASVLLSRTWRFRW